MTLYLDTAATYRFSRQRRDIPAKTAGEGRLVMSLKLRVEITVDIEAHDFVEAAEHQSILQAYGEKLRSDYPQASITIKERRGYRLTRKKPSAPLQRSSVVKPYADRRRAAP